MLIQPKILHYSVTSESFNWVFWYWNVVVLVLSRKGLTRRWAHTSDWYNFVHWRNTVLSFYLIQIGLLDSASANIKAIGAQLPAEFYLLGSHSSHNISWHSAALLCEACDCCHVLQGMVDAGTVVPHVLTTAWSFLGGALPVQLPPVQCPGYAKERKARA